MKPSELSVDYTRPLDEQVCMDLAGHIDKGIVSANVEPKTPTSEIRKLINNLKL
jgi:hypothetical protein